MRSFALLQTNVGFVFLVGIGINEDAKAAPPVTNLAWPDAGDSDSYPVQVGLGSSAGLGWGLPMTGGSPGVFPLAGAAAPLLTSLDVHLGPWSMSWRGATGLCGYENITPWAACGDHLWGMVFASRRVEVGKANLAFWVGLGGRSGGPETDWIPVIAPGASVSGSWAEGRVVWQVAAPIAALLVADDRNDGTWGEGLRVHHSVGVTLALPEASLTWNLHPDHWVRFTMYSLVPDLRLGWRRERDEIEIGAAWYLIGVQGHVFYRLWFGKEETR
jgi:hypothetical protein